MLVDKAIETSGHGSANLRRRSRAVVATRVVALIPMGILMLTLTSACTQETQNEIGRAVQNWTGTDGILEVYAGEKLVKRFLKIDKLTTATGTGNREARPYRFGYGVLDANLNGIADPNESKVYFEFSDYSTSYIFFEKPR